MAENSLVWNFLVRGSAAAGKAFRDMGKGIEDANVKSIALGTALGNLAAQGVSQLFDLAKGAVTTGIKTADAMQQANIGFETLLKSSKAAKDFVSDLSTFAAKTPFEFPGLVDASRLLLGVGVEAKKVIPFLTDFGDAAGALSIKQDAFQRIVLAMSQSISAGRFSLGDLNQLMTNGLPVYTILSKALGKPVVEIRKMATAGQLLTKDVLPLLQSQMHKDYGGAMAKQAQTLSGLWSTLQDTWSQSLAKGLQPLIPVLQRIMPKATEALGKGVEKLSTAFRAFFLAAQDGDVTSDGLVGAFEKIGSIVHQYVIPAFKGAVAIGSALFGFYQRHQTTLQAVAVGLAAIVTVIKVWNIAVRIAATLQAAWNLVMATNPIGLVILAIAGLAAGLIYAYKHSEKFRAITQKAFQLVKDAAMAVWNWIKKNWPLILGFLINPPAAAALLIRKHWDSIKAGAKIALDGVISFFKALPGNISRAVGSLTTLLRTQGMDIIKGLLNGANEAATKIGTWVVDIGKKIVGGIKDYFGIKSPSTVMAGLGVHMIEGLIKGLASTSPRDIATKALGSLPNALAAMLQKGFVTIGQLPGKAIKALGDIGGDALGWIQGLFGGGGGGNSANQKIGQIMAAAYGWTGGQWEALRALWMGESGWNNNAQNPTSTAYGIAQFLNSTWASVGASKTSDPAGQIAAGLKYIRMVYGSPIGALSAWQGRSPHWYDEGGWLMPGHNWTYNGTRKPEAILTDQQWEHVRAAALGGSPVHVTVMIGERELTDIVDTRVERGIDVGTRRALSKRGAR